jgi:hypothetical protein
MYTLIATAKLNDINPQVWLAEVLARIADHPVSRWPWTLRITADEGISVLPADLAVPVAMPPIKSRLFHSGSPV